MFQTFDPVSDRTFASKHLPLLRAEMTKQNLDAFIVPHDDEYQNEYIPAYAERLMWVSGFSGSAGAAIIMHDRAAIFTDGRYTLQVPQQVDSDYFEFEDIPDTSLDAWLSTHAKPSMRVGYDPMLHTLASRKRLEAAAKKTGFHLVSVAQNPVDQAWTDQPPAPTAQIIPHVEKFAGESSKEKREKLAATLKSNDVDATLITAPPSLAWLLNIRGGDVARSPLPLGRVLLNADGTATFFVAPEKIGNELSGFLGDDIDIRAETDVLTALTALGEDGVRVSIDPTLAPVKYVDILRQAGASIVEQEDLCALPKAAKNATEVEGARTAHIRDGVAVTKFLHWLDTQAQSGDVDEITAAKKLESIRSQSDDLRDLSFDSISGAGPNGAICHYRVSTESNIKLDPGTLFLIDSGGQYPDGTTDITRTVPIGKPTAEMRDRFTRVLKGHIALATIKFPEGTSGHALDILARRPLWEVGLDYDHGTGHGVGSFLGVHEGPQRIAKAPNDQALHPGMIISNEPGFYKAGEFGIRIENLVVVTQAKAIEGGERPMMALETITLAPIHLDLVDLAVLTDEERIWLNAYHARVRKTLQTQIPADLSAWFENATRAI